MKNFCGPKQGWGGAVDPLLTRGGTLLREQAAMFSLILWFLTLESFGLFRIPLLLCCLVFYYALWPRTTLSIKTLMVLALILSLLIISATLGEFEVFVFSHSEGVDSIFEVIIGSVAKVVISLLCIGIATYHLRKGTLSLAIRGLLKFHVGFFYVQWLLASYLDFYIDPLLLIGDPSSVSSPLSIPFVLYDYRCAGLFEEPSTYFAFVFPFAAMLLIMDGRWSKTLIFSFLSFYLTFSTAALFVATIFLVGHFAIATLRSKSYSGAGKIAGLVMVFACVPLVAYLNLERLVFDLDSANNNAGSIRFRLILTVLNQEAVYHIFGYGLLGLPDGLYQEILAGNVAAVNDISVWFYVYLKFGILGVFLLFVFSFRLLKVTCSYWFFFCLMLTKINLLNYSFIFIFALPFLSLIHLSRFEGRVARVVGLTKLA